jgi:hypothetical protein
MCFDRPTCTATSRSQLLEYDARGTVSPNAANLPNAHGSLSARTSSTDDGGATLEVGRCFQKTQNP